MFCVVQGQVRCPSGLVRATDRKALHMKYLLTLILAFIPGQVLAHVGHVGEMAGHDHWVAGAAIGVAVGVAIWGWLKGEKSDEEDSATETDETDAQEA